MGEEIDVGLFVTCRLCIEETGQYQILPSIQEHFIYCFDITVDSFDGLPQLICKKCKEILNDFYHLKKRFCQKQADLMSKYKRGVRAPSMPQHDIVSSSQRTDNIESINTCAKKNDSSDSDDTKKAKKKKKKKTPHKSELKLWDHTGFKKEYVCVICACVCPNKETFMTHQLKHYGLLSKHSKIFTKLPSVSLKKIDGKCNITGKSNTVVFNSNEIIENCSSLCYIRYSKETESLDGNSSDDETESSFQKNMKTESYDTDDEITAAPKKRKRRRLVSRSSSDTVVVPDNTNVSDEEQCRLPDTQLIINNNGQETSNNECIDITDSEFSDSETDVDQTKIVSNVKQSVEAKIEDYKIIQGIINMCVKSYLKKTEGIERPDRPVNADSQLKRKVLSIGRKIINKTSSNWTGLLKYMEHKNLSIAWAPKAISNSTSKHSDYMRIMMKLRETDKTDDNHGWIPVEVTEISQINNVDFDMAEVVPSVSNIQPTISSQVHEDINRIHSTASEVGEDISHVQPVTDSAVLYFSNITDAKNKLLNANPVSNPKKYVKVKNNDSKVGKTVKTEHDSIVSTVESCSANTGTNDGEDANLCMPIITSTTSLAMPKEQQQPQNNNTVSNSTTTVPPRIKVKPVAELMSQSMLNTLRNELNCSTADLKLTSAPNMLENRNSNPANILYTEQASNLQRNPTIQNKPPWAFQSTSNNIPPNIMPHMKIAQSMPLRLLSPQSINFTVLPPHTLPRTESEEYGIMNSVDLPNEKTNSPFQYLKRLFVMHSIILLDPQTSLSRDFILMIKFKVKFQQEPIVEPLILCLSLYCCKNQFCLTVKDRNDICLVNINEISANWQWEIINVFRGEIVEKILQNAQKYSTEIYNFTHNFLCLLRSVTYTKLS